jgi:beta-glucosidase
MTTRNPNPRLYGFRLAILVLLATNYLAAQGPATDVDQKVNTLLARLTMDQKIDLIGGFKRKYIHGIPAIGLPDLRMSDGPLGIVSGVMGGMPAMPSTSYAGGIGLAAAWDPMLANRVGAALGADAKARGVQILLGPGVNIYRSPMNGRNFEYFGEDPYLTSRIAVGYIEGLQSQGVIATVKHFAANNSEYDRHNTDSLVDEQTLHEIYLPAFEAAVKEAHVGAVMDSYNLLNGVHLTQNCALNQDILRKQWHFDGILMSDWAATYDGVAAANCGLDLEMPVANFMNRDVLLPAIHSKEVSEATIDDKVRNILRTAIRFGLLTTRQMDVTQPLYSERNRNVALQTALEGIVLVKNEKHILPLNPDRLRTIAVIGPDAYPAITGGGGSSSVPSFAPVSFLAGVADDLGDGTKVLYQRGLPTVPEVFSETEFDGSDPSATLRLETFAGSDLIRSPLSTKRAAHIDGWRAVSWTPPLDAQQTLRWTGTYTPKHSGRYLILAGAVSRDTYKVILDGHLVLEETEQEGQVPRTCEFNLIGGKPIAVDVQYQPRNATTLMGFGIRAVDELVSPAAKEIVAKADAVLLSVGFDATTESEGMDRTFNLPWGQDALIQTIAAINPKTVVNVTSGGGVDMRSWIDAVPAVFMNWYPGQEGGRALANLLFGQASPEGKLPISLDRSWEENPTHDSYYPNRQSKTQVQYSEGLFVGYRYYTTMDKHPLFPFGFGLTYTNFAFSNLKLITDRTKPHTLDISFDLKNIGLRKGSDVAQVYVGLNSPEPRRPVKELKAFQKVQLAPGETQHVHLVLDERSLSLYDTKIHDWRTASGPVHVYVGDSSESSPLKDVVSMP